MPPAPGTVATTDDEAPVETSEFDAAFDEIASPKDDTQPDPGPADDSKDGDPSDDDQPSDDQPGADPAPGSGQPAAQAPAGPTDDPFANATPEQRAYLDRLNRDYDHRLRSANGRVSALDRELAKFRGGSQPTPEAPAQKDDKAKPGADPAASELLGSDDFKAFEEEFPEIANPLKGVISRLESRLAAAEGTVGTVQEDRTAAVLAANEQALTTAHPDWLDCAKDDRFAGWAQTQPKAIQEAIARNWDGIVDPEDAGLVFERFKAQVGAPASTASPAPAPTPAPAPLDAKRQRQLNAGRDATAKTPSTAADEPDDYDAAFDNASRKIDRENASRYGTRNR